jgi:hypothetical protein
MIESLAISLGLDDFSILQIIALSGVCGFMVSQILSNWMGMVAANIGLFSAAFGSNILFRKFGVILTHNKQLDGILFSTIGLIGGALIVVFGLLAFSWMNNRVGMSAQKLRARAQAEEAQARNIAARL